MQIIRKPLQFDVVRRFIIETESIRFEGNNYSAEWEAEASRRGLPNSKRTAYALDALVTSKNMKLLEMQYVLSKNELYSHYTTKLEQYIKTIEIEAETFC